MKSPAPTSRKMASAVCAATIACPPVRPKRGKPERAFSLMTAMRSRRVARRAGMAPNSSPDSSVRPAPKASNRPSSIDARLSVRSAPKSVGMNWLRRALPAPESEYARTNPNTPPANDSTRLSVINWRTIRARDAPSANRVAISRERALPRASSSPAMFAHAASSKPPTTIRRTTSGVAVPSRRVDWPYSAGTSKTRGGSYGSDGGVDAIDAASTRSRSIRASSSLRPGATRATTRQGFHSPRFCSGFCVAAATSTAPFGTTMSGETAGSRPKKPSGMTPTMANVRPFSRSVRLVTSSAPPNVRSQNR